MPVGYFTFDQNYLIIDANNIGAEILAVQRDSLLAKSFTDFVTPDSRDTFIRHCNNNINNNKNTSQVHIITRLTRLTTIAVIMIIAMVAIIIRIMKIMVAHENVTC